jgi:trimeric autotransporter adhesin
MLMLPLWGISLCWAGLSHAAPSGAQITAGSGSVTQSGNVTSIVQSSNNLFINWQSFNVSSNEVVNFVQPGAGALAVNRILGNSPSQIFGHLNANGQVWLINPDGVLFGRGSQVNVGGLVVTTLDLDDATLDLDGRTFSGTGTGTIVNEGTLRATEGGYVALLGNQVSNRGVISAQLGTVALAAGSAETLTFSGRQLIHVQVDRSTLNDLADNRQLIEADGGQVIMTAGAKDSLLASAVNNTGIVQAHTVENHDGTITLLAGMQAGEVHVGGTLDATAPTGEAGGAIETSGASVAVAGDAKVLAGPGGSWRIDPTDLTIDAAAATAIETSLNSGTSVTEQTTATSASGLGTQSAGLGDIDVDAAISWTNPAATLTLSAYNAINVNAAVSGAGPVVMQATNGNLTIASGASIAGNSGVTLGTGASFVNLAGAGALSAGSGARWLVYSTNPATDTTGGLTPDFIQYAAPFAATPAQASGDGLLYSAAPSIAVTALGGSVSKTYDGGTAATLTAAGANYTVSGLLNGDTVVSMSGSYQSADAGGNINVTSAASAAGLTVTNSNGVPVYGYALTGSPLTAAIGSITPALLSAAIVGDPTKVYDGTTTATLTAANYSLSGFVAGQSATVNQPSSVAYASAAAGPQAVSATFSNTNFVAGSGTNLSNYVLPTSATGAGTVLQAPLVISGVLATSKVYDGTTTDTLNIADAGIYGVIGSDAVSLSTAGATGTFATGNAGNNIGVTTSGFSLTGTQASDYRLVQPTGLAANITPAPLTVTGVSATNRIYDGTTSDLLNTASAQLSGVVGNDASTLVLSTSGAAGAFTSPNVGTGLPVTASGFSISGSSAANYDLTQPSGLSAAISPAPLTITLVGNPTKPYNGTTTAALSASNFTLTGFVSGEGATLPQTTLAEYASANAGTETVLSLLATPDFFPAAATLLSNYLLPTTVSGTGTITPAPLTGVLIGNPTKVYDGTTSATLGGANYALSGFLPGQGATINQTSGVYASANAGVEQVTATVTSSDYVATGSTLLSNYMLPSTFTGSGTITQAALAGYISAGITGNPTKSYDGTTTATLNAGNFLLSGFANGQGASVTQTVGEYASANAGTQAVTANLTASDFTANTGTSLSNYTLPSEAYGTGTITPATLSVSIVGNPTRVYNGNTSMVLSPSNYSITGFATGQGAVINPSALINYAGANVGAESISASLTPSAYTANSGTLLTNYVLASSAGGMGTITAAPLYITGVYGTNKVYDTTTNDPLNIGAAALSGVVPGDSGNVTLTGTAAGTFSTSQVGNGLPVSVSGYSISGSAASNYSLQPISGLSANITPAPLSIAGVSANSKPYDGTNTATLNASGANLTGILGSDSVSLSVTGAAGTFSSSNVGNNLQVNANGFTIAGAQASDYALSQPSGLTANITPAPITALIIGNPTKVYDGSPSTTLTAANYTLVGFAPNQGASVPQSASASYATPDASTGVPITSTLVLSDFLANTGTNLSNYQLPTAGAGTGTITQAPLTLTLIGNPTKTYDGTATATLASANYNLSGFVGGQSATVTQTSGAYGAPNAGSQPVTAALTATNYTAGSGTNLNNYALPASAAGNGTIQPAPLAVVNVSTTPQVYNGTTVDALTGATLSGTVYAGDNPILAAGTYSTGMLGSNGNAGTDSVTTTIGLSGPGSSNYVVIQPTGLTAVISPAPLTATSSVTKTYDGTTVANLSGSNTTFSGFVNGQGATVDSGVTGTFSTSNAGSGLTVTGGALTGGDLTAGNGTLLSNYTLPASDNGSGTINPAALTYNAAPLSQQYGTTPTGMTGSVSGFVDGQTLATATTGTALFSTAATSSSNVGHYAIDGGGLTADNGNYTFVQAAGNATALTITPAALSIVGVTTTSRPYDGTTVDALSGATLVGTFYNGDSPTLTNTATGTLGNAGNAGTDSVTTAMGLSGPGSSNYSVTQPSGLTAVISAVALSATSSVTKSYDGTTAASLGGGNTALTGFVTGQGAVVDSGVTGSFANANVGSGIVVTGGALTSSDLTANNGTLLSNYVLPGSDNGTGTINPAIVNLAGARTYDAATDAAAIVFGSGSTVNGVNGETLTLTGSGTLAGKNAGSESLASLGTLTLGNGTGLASNYTLVGGTDSVNVSKLAITVTASAADKTYDANTTAVVTLASTGVLNGDSLTFHDTSANFSTANAGAGETVTVSGITETGSGNYTVNTSATASASINAAIVNLSGTRTYDGATDAAGGVFGSAGTVNTGIGSQTLVLSGSGTLTGKNAGSESLASLGTLALGNGSGLASNYTLVGGTDTVTVTPATLTYTAGLLNESYGTTPSGLGGAVNGFLGGDSLSNATSGSALFSTAATSSSNVGSYAVTGSGLTADNGNYIFAQAAGNATALSITPAIVNLSGTRTYDGASDAAASIFGASGTVSTGIGSQTLLLSGSGTLAGKNAGGESLASFGTLSVANGSGLASNYTLLGGTDVVSVTPATLTYTAGLVSESYGTAPSGLSGAVSGFVGSDSLANATTGSALFSTAATSSSNVGSYAITGNGLTANNGNYTFVQAPANSTALAITAAIVNLSGTRTYDAATDAAAGNFGSAGTVSGVNGETLTLSGMGTLAGKNAGSESVTSLGTLSLANGSGLASNYTLVGGADAVSVTPSTLTYTAGPLSESYGTTPSGLSGMVNGFLGSDSLSNATTGSALFSTVATASSNVGSYAITGGGLVANNGNYTFAQAAGNATAFSIAPAIVNLSGTRTYDGATDAAGSIFGSTGTVNTGIGSQTLLLSGSGTLAGKNAGSESLSSLGSLSVANGTGLASNYTLVGGTDTVSVTPATLTYTAGLVSESYGTSPSGLSGTVSGFVGGDSLANATSGSALFSTAATSSSNVGSYAVTGSGLTVNNGNYTFAQAAGNATALSITPAIVNLSGTRTYDGATDATGSVFGSAGTVSTGIGSQTLLLAGSGTLAGKNTGSESLASLGTLTLGNGTGLASNYTLVGGADAVSVSPLAITVSATGINRVYNGTVLDAVTLASNGVLAGDQVSFTDGSATFANKNVGDGKAVSVTGITVGGADGEDYTVNAIAATTANITPATLTESATPMTVAAGKVPALTGTVSGFVPGDTLADATSGTLAWSTNAPPYPTLGVYPIDGSGLSAANYVIVQAPSNASALKVTAMPETAATQRVYGLLDVPLTPPRIATPYGVGSSNEDGNNTGNERRDPDPTESNRRLADFTGRLALTVVDGGVRLPTEAARSGVAQ